MGIVLRVASVIGLGMTVVPAFFVWYGVIPWKLHVQLMFIGMVLWFIATPLWMNKEKTG